ncbi:hypothetical protein Cylst_1325 [Cylindrospermum stagnale PCC 7417]|uniref:Uncharacterized protein n=1 Tax=Cylindrospermum stagnale PCC 7417 TaxID=56107 RepID=K9WTC7_9NOST|nr:type IV pilin-like G/H family protein [Cylindrospermum stagnale]AFZ23615.1 hypothetical protein Cylst_1325 [Cylindrospermum stagnale PCC 7417]
MPKIFFYFGKLSIASKLLNSSVFISLLMTLDTTVLAQKTTPPLPSPSLSPQPSPQPTNPISQKLLGQWEGQDSLSPPKDAPNLTLIFTPEGKLFLLLPDFNKLVAVEFKYGINPAPKPMHMDVTISNNPKPVLTIFEFTADDQLRLQLYDTNSGQPRPKAFTQTASLFKKVSDNTRLPDNTKVIDPVGVEDQTRKEPEVDAKQIIGLMNRAQQAYYLEYSKFASTIKQLQAGIKPESETYRYQVVPSRQGSQSVINIAAAKKPELKSYTGVVFFRKVNGETLTYSAICETEKPSTIPPVQPQLPTKESQPVQCPAGSILLKP